MDAQSRQSEKLPAEILMKIRKDHIPLYYRIKALWIRKSGLYILLTGKHRKAPNPSPVSKKHYFLQSEPSKRNDCKSQHDLHCAGFYNSISLFSRNTSENVDNYRHEIQQGEYGPT